MIFLNLDLKLCRSVKYSEIESIDLAIKDGIESYSRTLIIIISAPRILHIIGGWESSDISRQ